MNALRLYAFCTANGVKRAWSFTPSAKWFTENDNGHAVSIGYNVGEDITEAELSKFGARPADYEKAQHASCQTRCALRGDSKCVW